MRYLYLIVAFIFLLAGCSAKQDAGDADRIREYYASAPETEYTVTLRTDFGDRVLDFTVNYLLRTDGSGHMTVTAPELIEGIGAEIGASGVSLQYDGLTLELGALPGTGLSPLESLPFITGQWSKGYVTQTGSEKRAGRSLTSVTTRTTQNTSVLEVTTLFDKETLAPVQAELFVNGFLTVTAIF